MKNDKPQTFNVPGSHAYGRDWQTFIYNNNNKDLAFIAIGATEDESKRNGKLAEAAPELLEAAILLSQGISEGDKEKLHKGNLSIKEAIKKATE